MNPHTSDPAVFAPQGLPQADSDTDKNGSRLDNQEQGPDTEELAYDFVPPKQTVTVSVRYRISGRGQPLPYPLDEE
jgi:hypothetical protein